MRPLLIGLTLFSTFGLLFAACSQDPGSAAASATTSASGTGGAPNCDGVVIVIGEDAANPCDVCLHDYCCAELSECRDQDCIHCVNYLYEYCGPKPRAVSDCLYAYCQPICSPGWAPSTSSSTTSGG